jgi:N-acetylmuramoyl-L-alanine amidase
LLAHAAGLTLLGGADLARAARMLALRVWPAREYSRITLESDEPLRQRLLQSFFQTADWMRNQGV